jgi:cytochrome c oxidase subunit 3
MSETAANNPLGARSPALHHQFQELVQQYDASSFGMWVFLATEILFFGGLFTTYIVYRSEYYSGFAAGSHGLEGDFGAAMTFILLTSSFTMAMGVRAARQGKRAMLVFLLLLTIVLGLAFLGIKFTEYSHKWHEQMVPGFNFHPSLEELRGAPGTAVELFMCFYFFLTGLHALHMIIGITMVIIFAFRTAIGRFHAGYHTPITIIGLYWHFVDVVWVFLFAIFYISGLNK